MVAQFSALAFIDGSSSGDLRADPAGRLGYGYAVRQTFA